MTDSLIASVVNTPSAEIASKTFVAATYLTPATAASTYVPYSGATGTVDLGAEDLATTGAVKGVHKASDGTAAVADGTYIMGLGTATNGTITIKDGVITAVTEATDA